MTTTTQATAPTYVNYGWRRYKTAPGAHAEVTGVTQYKRRSQRATLLITWPGKRPRTIRLTGLSQINHGHRFTARFNDTCSKARQ